MFQKMTILDMNTIEIHYWLQDGLHTMNAHVFNKCEREFLGIVNELAASLNLKVEVEVEPIGEGGIRSWFRFCRDQKDAIKVAFLIFLLTDVLCSPLKTTLEFVTKEVLERVFEDPEIKALEKEKKKEELKLDIYKLRTETERQCKIIDENKLKKKRSNYYEVASQCKTLEKISVLATDANKEIQCYNRDVLAADFPQFVMTSNDLDPTYDEDASIEIISPVLKNGKYLWLGIYNGTVIQFKMKSNEFKDMVLNGQVPFKNGSSIACLLVTNKKIDSQGDEKITGYEVLEVYNYFENDTPIETPEGKRRRQKEDAEKRQLSLFKEEDY